MDENCRKPHSSVIQMTDAPTAAEMQTFINNILAVWQDFLY